MQEREWAIPVLSCHFFNCASASAVAALVVDIARREGDHVLCENSNYVHRFHSPIQRVQTMRPRDCSITAICRKTPAGNSANLPGSRGIHISVEHAPRTKSEAHTICWAGNDWGWGLDLTPHNLDAHCWPPCWSLLDRQAMPGK